MAFFLALASPERAEVDAGPGASALPSAVDDASGRLPRPIPDLAAPPKKAGFSRTIFTPAVVASNFHCTVTNVGPNPVAVSVAILDARGAPFEGIDDGCSAMLGSEAACVASVTAGEDAVSGAPGRALGYCRIQVGSAQPLVRAAMTAESWKEDLSGVENRVVVEAH